MAASPSENVGRLLSCVVTVDGKKLNDSFMLVSADVSLELNHIGKARLKFNAGNMDKQTLDESDDSLFKPGSSVKLDAGDPNKQETIFEGLIASVRIQVAKDAHSYMILECRDNAFPATLGRKNRIFEKKSDSDIIKETLSSYGNVSVDATTYKHDSLVQYYCSDWDFALSRADACGLYVLCDGKQIMVKKPDVDGAPAVGLTFGVDIIDFNLELTSDDQYADYQAVSWSTESLQAVVESAPSPKVNKQGDLDPGKIASGDKMLLQTDSPTASDALKMWAGSVAQRSVLSRYQGTVSFCGTGKVKPGSLIELKGLGKRFNGNLFVGSVHHRIKDNVWITEAGAGVPSSGIMDEPDVESPSASGFLPGLHGLHSAVVKKLDGDPLSEYRIQVELPWMAGQSKLLWARLASLYSTDTSSMFFLPEVGDEVVVGFMNNDPTHPVVIGSFYGKAKKPPFEYDKKNNTKAIVTRAKLEIVFDEEKKVMTLKTPAGNMLELSDDSKSICLKDQHGNEIKMDGGGIAISSGKDIKLTAKAGISLDATAKIACSAKSDASLEGLNVNVQAKVGATVKGNAKAELSASGQTVVKGAMVMIN